MKKLEKIIEKYSELWETVEYKEDVFLIIANEVPAYVYYVESGIMKTFRKENNKEVITALLFAGETLIPHEYAMIDERAPANVAVKKGSILKQISIENWQKILQEEPELSELAAEIIERLQQEIVVHLQNTVLRTPEEYYVILQQNKKYADKLSKLTNEQIALYMGGKPIV